MSIGGNLVRFHGPYCARPPCRLQAQRHQAIRGAWRWLSWEKREGTLGLLCLADLTGHDVVLGKLAVASLNSFYGLLAIIPVLGTRLLMGGVTGGEFWRVALVLGNRLVFSLSLGLWVSAWSHEAYKAAVTTVVH